jgi:hypothetical protein
LLAFEHLADAIEERMPLLLLKLAGRHDEPPVQRFANGSRRAFGLPDREL